MNTKKIICIFLTILIVIGVFIFLAKNKKNTEENINEFTPQEEISGEQMRETIVSLYFLNPDTKELQSEGRLVDSKLLLQNPYKLIVELLINGPKNEDLTSVFPDNTRILDANIENSCVTLNFSEEITNFKDDNQKHNIINSILNSLSALNEVDSIKILINNKENKNYNEKYSAIY